MGDRDWIHRGACRGEDPELFSAYDEDAHATCRRICGRCNVRDECFDYAVARHEHGFWGGMTEHERDVERRRRAAQASITPEEIEAARNRLRVGRAECVARSERLRALARDLAVQGVPVEDIAARVERSPATVKDYLRGLNLGRRTPTGRTEVA